MDRLVPDTLLFFKKGLDEVKASGTRLDFKWFPIVVNVGYNKNKLSKSLKY